MAELTKQLRVDRTLSEQAQSDGSLRPNVEAKQVTDESKQVGANVSGVDHC